MKSTLSEYRAVLGVSVAASLCVAGSLAFAWFAAQERTTAIDLLKKRSTEINRFRNATPPPTKEQAKQLEKQLEDTKAAYTKLKAAIASNNQLPPRNVSPQEFQKSLNEKAQALFKKAEAESITLPPTEGDGSSDSFFYLNFKDYKTKPPSAEKAPILDRQFKATEILLNLLFATHPISIRKVRLLEPEPPKLPAVPAKGAKAEPKPQKPIFDVQGFDLHFSTRPENLRAFLNAIAAEKRGFFVARNLKVVNSKEKEPLKKGEGSLGQTATIGGAGGENAARYVLGDEFVEVELTLDMMTLAPESDVAPKDAPKPQ